MTRAVSVISLTFDAAESSCLLMKQIVQAQLKVLCFQQEQEKIKDLFFFNQNPLSLSVVSLRTP